MDLVLCPHGHTDHFDPETLQLVAVAQPACRFVVPRAWLHRAASVPSDRVIDADGGDRLDILPRLGQPPWPRLTRD